MSGAGTPPETGTFAAGDDRYNGNMSSGSDNSDFTALSAMMPGQQNSIFPGMPEPDVSQPQEQSPLFPQDAPKASPESASIPSDRREVADYISKAAAARGIDPNTALRVFTQESGLNPHAQNINNREKSYGVAQLNTQGGLGAVAKQQGIDPTDPSQWRQQIDFSLDTVAKDGWRQWYGARDVGIGRWQGVDRRAANAPGDVVEFSAARRKPPGFMPDGSTMLPEIVVTPEGQPEPPIGDSLGATPNAPEGDFAPFQNMDIPFKDQLEALASLDQPVANVDPIDALTYDRPLDFGAQPPPEEPQFTPVDPTKLPKFDSNEKTAPSFIDSLTRGVRQAGRGATETAGQLVYGTGANLAALQALPNKVMGIDDPMDNAKVTFWKDLLASSQRGAQQITGLQDEPTPRNPVEELALLGGRNMMPAGKLTLPLAGISTGVEYGVSKLISPAESAKRGTSETFAGMLSPGNIPVDKIAAPVNATYVKEPDGSVIAVPSSSIYGALNLPEPAAVKQWERTGVFYGHFQTEADARAYIESINDRVQVPVNTVGGPTKVKTSELALMGTLGAATIGMMFAPQVFRMFKSNTPRLGRPVDNAAPGTEAFTTRGDLARTYLDDVNAAPLRVAGAMITDQNVLKRVQDTIMMQTRGAASNIADSAVRNGIAQGPNFSFKVKVPLLEMQRRTNPQVEQYLNLMDTFDDLQKIRRGTPAAPGPAMVRGLTEADVLQQVGALEQVNPGLRQVGTLYRDNLKNFRSFLNKGEYGVISNKELKRLNSENPNEVPFTKVERIWEDANYKRQSPFIALGETMRTKMRMRMENEAKGVFIDAMRKEAPSSFVRITPQQLANNRHWEPNTVKMYRRGKPELYTTDPLLADAIKMDPYFFQNRALDSMYRMKRVAEATTTGVFAPWFAETSFLRNHQIATHTPIPGMKAPHIGQSLLGIPRQLVPQAAHAIATRLEQGSDHWLTKVMGPSFSQSLSHRLLTAYKDSLFARLEAAGSHRGSILEHQVRDPNAMHWTRLTQTNIPILDSAINKTTGATRTFIEGWKATFGALHNAPSYAFARKNQGKLSIPELALKTRQLTGDPMSGGQFMSGGKMLRFQDQGILSHLKTKGVQYGVGLPAEIGRVAIPWFNPSVQGMKRIGQAYLEDPKRFVANAWLYTQLPAATGYAWNRSLGVDPQGQSYSDYQMNGRSDYNTMMNYYIGVPGRPVSQGIQIPRFHELAPVARWMEIAMDHAFRSSQYSQAQDFQNVAANGVKVILGPAMPPLGNVAYASAGMVGPQGVFEGEGYKRADQPFDQNSGLPVNIELYMRAIAPGLADVFGAGAAAALNADDGTSPVGAFLKEAGKRTISKAPITRAITNIQPPATGNTRYTEDLFAKQKAIDQLNSFYKSYGLLGGDPTAKKSEQSKAGGMIATQSLGNPLPDQTPGLGQPEPTNPLYKLFMQELHEKFKRDDPANGGMGFRSTWTRYSKATDSIKKLQKVNSGNYVTWQRQLEARPETLAFLKDNNVDYKDPLAVKSFYEMYRQSAAKQLLYMIKGVEAEFSQRLGTPIKIENLDPYNRGGISDNASDMLSDQTAD